MRSRTRGWTAAACAVAALVAPGSSAAKAPEPAAGWAQAALDTQYDVAGDVGWTNMPWIGTHNSYNSRQQTGVALSSNDANQRITNVKQLEAGLRALELDVHRFPDVAGPLGALRVCHARGADQGHLGCSTEKELGPTLDEIAGWLDRPENSQEVLLLYLEDHMGDAQGYNAAANVVTNRLGDRLYAPPPGGCSEVPAALTREEIQAAGKQVLIVSDCGPSGATGWHGVAHNWNSHLESRPVDYEDYPSCGPDYDIPTYETRFVRYYEDRTALTNQVGPPTGVATPDDGVTPPTAAAMARCGVDLIHLDLFSGPEDPRLEGLVWSWQVNRPKPIRRGAERVCASQRTGVPVDPALAFPGSAEPATRAAWFDWRCARLRPAACRDAAGEWSVVPKLRKWAAASAACERRGLVLGTPRTGYEAQQLDDAIVAAGVTQAWMGIKREGDTWAPTDPPPALP